ncbi:MAG: sigma-54 dependent transcriptional regulator [Pirellulales bacterium]|nr:sigma-54 dependent transcriptional regulator [Pirellulales bacterium]
MTHGRVLVVDDEASMCELLEADLRLRGFDVAWRTSAEEAFTLLRGESFDCVVTDLNMPGVNGIELCERIVAHRPDVPVIVMTAFGSMETAIAAIRAGAYDFVTKPLETQMLALTLERSVRHRRLQEEVKLLSEVVKQARQFGDILGESLPMQQLFDQLARVAESEAAVLITGESGSGKELVAQAIHSQSSRREKPFVAVNCAALPGNLLESELFGHVEGAFTDAREARKGLFQQAQCGTLFLDEVGELPLAMQPKLLRALEENTIRPIGSDQETPIDVRILTATNRDLESAVEESRFRQDLYYRINVIQLAIPPLRARGTDILLLAQHFVEGFAAKSQRQVTGLSEPVAERLLNYSWPGNVRELRNVIERAVALTGTEKLSVEDLPEKIQEHRGSHIVLGGENPAELPRLEDVEQRYIRHVMEAAGGNKTLAAKILGVDRKTLRRKLKED